MKNSVLLGEMLGILLLAVSPAFAVIQANLENPGPEVSGIDQVSGWAFAENGAPVTVRPRIDGSTQTDVTIPCCGPRQDVVNERGSETPLDTGFSGLINFGNLTPGLHLIGVEISAEGEDTLPIERQVLISKPGGRDGEDPALFSFLNDLAFTDVTQVAVDLPAGELIAAPVEAMDSGAGGIRPTTVRLAWLRSSQRYTIVSAASDTSFAAVQEIFTNKCAIPGCHIGEGSVLPAAQNLSTGSAFRNLVPVRSLQDPARFRINPGDATASYLYQKIIPNGDIASGTARMPITNCCLSESEIEAIEAWINAGAPPPQ